MIDYYLKMSTKDAAEAVLVSAGLASIEDGVFICQESSETICINIVGVLSKPNLQLDPELQVEVMDMIPLDGYHVNIRIIEGDLPEALIPFVITPGNPLSCWL